MTLEDWQKKKSLSDSEIFSHEYLERVKSESEIVLCACGCGEWRGRYDKTGKERHYIQGHYLRGNRIRVNQENMKKRTTEYPLIMSVRITDEMNDELPRIASFENMKPSALCRQELLKMIRRYQRNPQYKSWLKRTEKIFKG